MDIKKAPNRLIVDETTNDDNSVVNLSWTKMDELTAEFSSLPFKVSEDGTTISVKIDGFWYGVYSSSSEVHPNWKFIINANTFKEKENKLIELGFQNYFATVNSDGSIAVSQTEGVALEERKDPDAFVAWIGGQNQSNRVVLLFLREMHPNFDKTRE